MFQTQQPLTTLRPYWEVSRVTLFSYFLLVNCLISYFCADFTFDSPDVPVLLQILSGDPGPSIPSPDAADIPGA